MSDKNPEYTPLLNAESTRRWLSDTQPAQHRHRVEAMQLYYIRETMILCTQEIVDAIDRLASR